MIAFALDAPSAALKGFRLHANEGEAISMSNDSRVAFIVEDGAIAVTSGALEKLDRDEDAMQDFDKAIELDSKSADAHFSRGHAKEHQGRQEEAIAEYRKAIEADSKHAMAHLHLGTALLHKGQVDEALAELEALAEHIGTASVRATALYASGVLALRSGSSDGARRLLTDAADLFEQAESPFEAGRARLELARALLTLDRHAAARSEAAASLSLFERLGAARDAAAARRLLASSEPASSSLGRRSGSTSTTSPPSLAATSSTCTWATCAASSARG